MRSNELITESERAYNKEYRLKNLEKLKAYRKQYYQKTKTQALECSIRWNKEHADLIRNRARIFYKLNVKKLRKNGREIRLKLLRHLGDQCTACGYNDNELALQIDHIDGSGGADKKRFKSTTTYYRYYLNHFDITKVRLQILCANCNIIKRFENREVNHKFG